MESNAQSTLLARHLWIAKRRYLPLEKLVLAFVLTSQKLVHYFQAHPIAMYMEFLLKTILSKANLSIRLSKWAIKIGQSDIKFLSRAAIKGQVLANFIAEFPELLVQSRLALHLHIEKGRA